MSWSSIDPRTDEVVPYSASDNSLIEEAFKAGRATYDLVIGDLKFKIDFKKMVQRNAGGHTRQVKRAEPEVEVKRDIKVESDDNDDDRPISAPSAVKRPPHADALINYLKTGWNAQIDVVVKPGSQKKLAKTPKPKKVTPCTSMKYSKLFKEIGLHPYASGTLGTPPKIDFARQLQWSFAKMGRGYETVLDLESRKTKVVSKTEAAVSIPEMPAVLESIRQQLLPWLEPGLLKAELHNILMYNEGSFFKTHRDSPKGDGHIMTLSVEALPVGEDGNPLDMSDAKPLQGGEVKFTFFGSESESYTVARGVGSWNAWFNSTFHEITPVTAGTSLRAIFNVSITCGFDDPRANAFHLDKTQWWGQIVTELAARFQEHDEDAVRGWAIVFPDEYLGQPEKPRGYLGEKRSRWDKKAEGMILYPVQLIGRDRLFYEAVALYRKNTKQAPPKLLQASICSSNDSYESSKEVVPLGKKEFSPIRKVINIPPPSYSWAYSIGEEEDENTVFDPESLMEYIGKSDERHQNSAGNDGGGYVDWWERFVVKLTD